ncbi:MAG TPA: Ig-like domain-containing protein [Gammaproteobacteria bacterium]|nr:Ig-like domain-containing protein [Gammaproteobacteria bacterium]
MKQRNLCAMIALTASMLVLVGCGGAGGYGSSSGGGGSGLVASIAITPTSSTIAPSASQQFKATAKDSNGNTVTGVTLTWKSSDNSIATINSSGLATGVAAGTTNITASVDYGGTGCTGPYCNGSGQAYTITSNKAMLTVSATGMVMGTAAVGHPFAAALVNLKDAQGQTQFAVTDAHGRFSLAVSGLVAPFLLKVADDQGHVMYSLGNAAGVINIDPFSDVMARAWYQSHGTTVETAFANPRGQPIADDASLKALNSALVTALAQPIAAHGLNPGNISLLNTPFTADSSGLDGLLDHTSFSHQGNRFLMHNLDTGHAVMLEATGRRITIQTLNPAQEPATPLSLKY